MSSVDMSIWNGQLQPVGQPPAVPGAYCALVSAVRGDGEHDGHVSVGGRPDGDLPPDVVSSDQATRSLHFSPSHRERVVHDGHPARDPYDKANRGTRSRPLCCGDPGVLLPTATRCQTYTKGSLLYRSDSMDPVLANPSLDCSGVAGRARSIHLDQTVSWSGRMTLDRRNLPAIREGGLSASGTIPHLDISVIRSASLM